MRALGAARILADARSNTNRRAQGEDRMIRIHARFRMLTVVAAAFALARPSLAPAQTAATPASAPSAVAATRDGQHDFDWMIGSWKVQLRRLTHPLSGSTTWVEYEGTQTTRKLFDSRANVDEFVVDSPATKAHLEGLTVRLYDPESRQWSIYWANMNTGALAMPPTVGRFTDGRGEFFDREEFEGKPIVVRYVWSDVTPTSARFEQAFSADDGKTWEPNWICTITRVKE
jgi:hypothetical protein